MDVRTLGAIWRQRWRLVSVLLLAGIAVAALITVIQKPVYRATAIEFVSIQAAASTTDLSQGTAFTQQVIKSYASVATTPLVLNDVRRRLNLDVSTQTLARSIDASAPLDQVVLNISVNNSSPQMAAEIANAVAARLRDVVATLSPKSSNSSAVVKLTEVQSAVIPTVPDSPRPALNLTLGFIAGLVAGLLGALIASNLDSKLRAIADLERISERPVLGTVLFDPAVGTRSISDLSVGNSPQAEAYRTLRTNLQFVEFGEGSRVITVTSSIAGEGKSTTAANLAMALAASGQRVLLIDADLRRPRIAQLFGLEGSVGLTSALTGAVSVEDACQEGPVGGLAVLCSGQIPPNPNELLQSERMKRLILTVREQFDTILLDAPPLLPVSDAAILSRETDGALICAASSKVRRVHLRMAAANLDRVGARTLGLILTFAPRGRRDSYSYSAYSYSHD